MADFRIRHVNAVNLCHLGENYMSFYSQGEQKDLLRVLRLGRLFYRHPPLLFSWSAFLSFLPLLQEGGQRTRTASEAALSPAPAVYNPRPFHSQQAIKDKVPHCLANPSCQQLSQKRQNLSKSQLKGPSDHRHHLLEKYTLGESLRQIEDYPRL